MAFESSPEVVDEPLKFLEVLLVMRVGLDELGDFVNAGLEIAVLPLQRS